MFNNMSRRIKIIQTKLKSGRSKEPSGGSYLNNKANVNEEYKEAFRTKSYIETWTQVQNQPEKSTFESDHQLSSSPPISNHHIDLSKYLLRPKQETLDKIETLNFHHLLILDYFEAGLKGTNLCELLLRTIHNTRVQYHKIRNVIKLSKKIQDFSNDQQRIVILKELESFASLKNPFSIASQVMFRDTQETNLDLFRKLTSGREKIRRQARFKRVTKQIGSLCLVISHTTFIIALVVIALHSMIGIIAAPGIAACFFSTKKKKKSKASSTHHQGLETSLLDRLGDQLDVSAKGIYVLINDFDTISRLVSRLHDEIEHRKDIANMCIRNGKVEVMKEVLREFCMSDSSFLEQLNELEEHTKLCFHTINRSRKLVIQEIVDAR